MKIAKLSFSARISALTKKLIALEVAEGGGSEADALERIAIRAASSSSQATKLVLEELEKDPGMNAILRLAMGAKPSLGGSADKAHKK